MDNQQSYIDELILLIRQKGQELDEGSNLSFCVQSAVGFYSKVKPRSRFTDLTSSCDGSTYDFTITGYNSDDDRFSVEEVETPTGEKRANILDPKSYKFVQTADDTYVLRLLDHTPTSSDGLWVRWKQPHTVDSDESTVPASHEKAVVYKAASVACLMMSSENARRVHPTISTDSFNPQQKTDAWIKLAKEFDQLYEMELGIGEKKSTKAGWAFIERDGGLDPYGRGSRTTHDEDLN